MRLPPAVVSMKRLGIPRAMTTSAVTLATPWAIRRGTFTQPPVLLSENAARNPTTVIRPAKSWASSKASGIIVSASMARIAPAATAVVAATRSGDVPAKATKPASDARPEATAIPP